MKKMILSVLVSLVMLASCSKENGEAKDTFTYFTMHLKAHMDYTALVKTFGEPDSDIGSGIHIYVYNLEDGTAIMIGYTNTILYARHVDKNHQLLHTLI
jgi:hypothetical protein